MPPKTAISPAPCRPLKALQPAPLPSWRQQSLSPADPPARCFFDLPAELRVEIYRLALQNVSIHIMPSSTAASDTDNGPSPCPHPLLRTSRQIRLEVLPLMQTSCPIYATVTDFDFGGILTWLWRIPPQDLRGLVKNRRLYINLCTTKRAKGDLPTLRRWLHDRADPCRPQPNWIYSGAPPQDKIASDLRRRLKRMPERKKAAELRTMLKAIGVIAATSSENDGEDIPTS